MEAIEPLNRDLFLELGLSGDEVRTLIGVLTKMRRAWGVFEGEPDGDLFGIAPGPAIADYAAVPRSPRAPARRTSPCSRSSVLCLDRSF